MVMMFQKKGNRMRQMAVLVAVFLSIVGCGQGSPVSTDAPSRRAVTGERIMELLLGAREPSGAYVDLAALNPATAD